MKRPGEQLIGDPTELEVVSHPRGDEMEAYERLLSDAMLGDATLFASQEGVEAAWRIVQPALRSPTRVQEYEPATWGPSAAEQLTRGICNCHSPVSVQQGM